MLRRLILHRLDAQEQKLGESLEYVRHIVRVSVKAFFKFAKVLALSNYRRVLPADACHVARIVATRDEDCGGCVQIELNLAKAEGVDPQVLRAVLDQNVDSLPADLANVYRFTQAVVRATYDEEPWRAELRHRYTEEGLVELALTIASCRVFPIVKRALGHAASCKSVEFKV